MEISKEVPRVTKNRTLDLAILLLAISPSNQGQHKTTVTCTPIFITALFITVKSWN